MRVIIAEKPSVAREYARVLKVKSRKDGYFEREGVCITWAFGHLVELADPKEYGFEKWRLADLPIVPERFKLAVSSNEGARKQFNTIKSLFDRATEIVVGTDAGREGELIFRYIYQMCQCKVPFKRLWISSQTDKAILDGFRNLKPGTEYNHLADAARSRSEADWMVGINATRCLTLSAYSKTVLSLGRVQTPVLAMICSRYIEHRDFTPEPYWMLLSTEILHRNPTGCCILCWKKTAKCSGQRTKPHFGRKKRHRQLCSNSLPWPPAPKQKPKR